MKIIFRNKFEEKTMDKYIIDNNLVSIGYYSEYIAIKLNIAISEIVTDLKRETGLDNIQIKINDCYIETDYPNKTKKIVLGYTEEILG